MAVKLSKSSVLASMSLTPLIDVVFLLLIFFLVATRFAEADRELDVQLPTASEAQPMTTKPKVLFINVDQQGRFYVGKNVLQAPEVEEVIERAAINNPLNQSVRVRADKRAPIEPVVVVINACKKNGIQDCALTVGK